MSFLQDFLDGERCEPDATTFVEFVLEFNPVKSQSMKEGLHEVHHH